VSGAEAAYRAALSAGAAPLSLAGQWDMWLGPADDALGGRLAQQSITVPSNWWLCGVDHSGKATFARTFDVEEHMADKTLRLRFDGVDYYCRVWIDGEPLGSHEGYFDPFWFDLPGLSAGSHRVVVEVDSPHEPWGTVWHMYKTLIKGVLGHHDARPGAAWSVDGQAANSGGIWAPVTLEAWPSNVIIDHAVVCATPAGERQATVEVTGKLSVRPGAPAVLAVALALTGPADSGRMSVEVAVPAGADAVEFHARARLPLADRWTTWDRGVPVLYDGLITVEAAGVGTGAPLATRSVRTGIRSVAVDPSYRWQLNGEEVWIRGTNYIGTFWPAEYTEERIRQDLGLIRDAGINQVRVHAHVAPPPLYEVADEMGLMIWQDFPLQWGYTDDPVFHREAHRQMQAMIRCLGSHPSVVAWCCHNESPWDAPWMAEEFGGAHDPGHNRQLDEDLEAIARAADPSRYVHRNSGTGDSHHYAGWYFGHWEDFASRPGGPFVTEYGSLAPPDAATLREIIPEEVHAYDSEQARRTWAFHDFQHQETEQYIKVLPSDGLEHYVAAAQAYQANLVQVATEAYRRGKARRPGGQPADGGPLITGIHHFMAVEAWESLTWAVLDHNRTPKPGYHALSRAMAPLLVCAELLDGREQPAPRPRSGRTTILRVWLINDRPAPVPEATLHWSARTIPDPALPAAKAEPRREGATRAAVSAEGTMAVDGAEGDSAMILGEDRVSLGAGWHRVVLRLHARDDRRLLAANHLDIEVRR